MTLFDGFDPEPEPEPAAAEAEAELVHGLAHLDQVNDRPVLTTGCGLVGPPYVPGEPGGLRVGWLTFITCPACRTWAERPGPPRRPDR